MWMRRAIAEPYFSLPLGGGGLPELETMPESRREAASVTSSSVAEVATCTQDVVCRQKPTAIGDHSNPETKGTDQAAACVARARVVEKKNTYWQHTTQMTAKEINALLLANE